MNDGRSDAAVPSGPAPSGLTLCEPGLETDAVMQQLGSFQDGISQQEQLRIWIGRRRRHVYVRGWGRERGGGRGREEREGEGEEERKLKRMSECV